MTANVVNRMPYLRTTRDFPEDLHQFTIEANRAYVDTALAVNQRTIAIFPSNRPALTGEQWFPTTQRLQTLRQIYTFTGAGSIPHGINTTGVTNFTKCSGSYTDGTNYYGAIFADSTAIPNQISFYITPTNIVILSGGGTVPTIKSGYIVLEWLSQP